MDPPVDNVVLTRDNLLQILEGVTQVPNQNLALMHQIHQANVTQLMSAMQEQRQLNQALLTQTSTPPDPLRRLRESDPQFPPYSGRPADFLGWLLEITDRKNQRQLPVNVAIQYALMALGNYAKGLFADPDSYATWADFAEALKVRFEFHNATEILFADTTRWKMNGNWLAFHSMVQNYKDFLPEALHPALKINFIAGLDPPMARKVNKHPKPDTLQAAIDKAWEFYRQSEMPDHVQQPTIVPPFVIPPMYPHVFTPPPQCQ